MADIKVFNLTHKLELPLGPRFDDVDFILLQNRFI